MNPASASYAFSVTDGDIFTNINGAQVAVAGKRAIIRPDTGIALAVVGPSYKIIKHQDLVDLASEALKQQGRSFELKVHMTHDGARLNCHFLLEELVTVGKPELGDVVALELILRNSYDGFSSVSFEVSGLRLVCKNGLRVPQVISRLRRIHTQSLEIDDLQKEIRQVVDFFTGQAASFWNALNRKELPREVGVEVIEQSVKSRRFPKKYVETIQQTWEGATARTAWELYNAFTAVITHSISPKSYERGRLLSYQVDRIFRELT